jgi:hypothetical protein
MFIGGDYQSGRIIGKSSPNAEEPIDSPFGPKDVVATVFDHMGFDMKAQRIDNAGRPKYFIQEESKVIL